LENRKTVKNAVKNNKSNINNLKEESKKNNNKKQEKNTSNMNKKNQGTNNTKPKTAEIDLNNSIDRHLVNKSAQTVITSTSNKQKLIMVDSSADSIAPNSTTTNSNKNKQHNDKNKNKKQIRNDEAGSTSSNKNTNNSETSKTDMIIREKSNLMMKKFDQDTTPMYDSVNDSNHNGDSYKLDQMHESIEIEDDEEENLIGKNPSNEDQENKGINENIKRYNSNTASDKPKLKRDTGKLLAEAYGEPYQDKKNNKLSSKEKLNKNNNKKIIIEAKLSDEKPPNNDKKKSQLSGQKFLREKTNNTNKIEYRVSDESRSPERKDSKSK
jgi:hypothetical protein